MNEDLHINERGLDIIKRYETLRRSAYRCFSGVPTIGYGHTRGVRMGMTCTVEEANEWLVEDVCNAEDSVVRFVEVPLNENQFSALVSFIFNVGGGAFAGSTLLRRLNAGDYEAVPAQLSRWTKGRNAKGEKVELAGLVKRRHTEGELWDEPV